MAPKPENVPQSAIPPAAPVVQAAPAVKENRFAAMFGAAIFTPATNTEIYDNRRGKSRQLAHVSLPFKSCDGATQPGTIYGRQKTGSTEVTADFTMPRGALEIDKTDASAMSDWIAFSADVAAQFLAWSEKNGVNSIVASKASGPVVKGLTL